MKVHFTKDALTGQDYLMVTREDADTDATLEDFASTVTGSVRMIHTIDALGKITLDEIVVALDESR